jgi:hypothetical protein
MLARKAGCSRLFRPFTIREIRKSPSAPTFAHSSSARVPTCCPASPHVFSTFRWYKHCFVDRIPIPSIVSSGEDLLARVAMLPIRRLDVAKAFSGYSIKFCLPQWCTPFFRVQPNTQ